MYKNDKYEKFIELYSIGKQFGYLRNNVREHVDSGAIGAWCLAMLGYTIYSIGLFVKGWLSLLMILIGTPLYIAWIIYLSQNTSNSRQSNDTGKMLEKYYKDDEIKNLMYYLSTHYTFEISALSWRNSFAMFVFTTWVGYVIGLISNSDKNVENMIISILTQYSFSLVMLAFTVSKMMIHRKDRIVMAIRDIKKYNFDKLEFK